MSDTNEMRAIEQWRETSLLVHKLRHAGDPAETNAILDGLARAPEHDLFAPAYAFWAADNAAASRRFDDAAERYLNVADQHADRTLFGEPWAARALRAGSDCYLRLFDLERARECSERLLDEHAAHASAAEVWLDLGAAFEEAGRHDEAAAWLAQAADADPGEDLTGALAVFHARRRLERLRSERSWMRASPVRLADELAVALRSRRFRALESLLSPTHAMLGFVASEAGYVSAKVLLEHLRGALKGARVRCDPRALTGDVSRCYLPVEGLTEAPFDGRIVLILGLTPHGYEWQGVGLGGVDAGDRAAMQRLADLRKRDNDFPGGTREVPDPPPEPPAPPPPPPPATVRPFQSAADLNLKCPFPAGLNLRAGMKQFIVKQSAFAAAAAATGPFAGLTLSLLVMGESIGSPCGFGPGGLYYGWPTTHVNDEFFAVDFARFVPGVPYVPIATRGTPVLAVAEGIVRSTTTGVATGTATAGGGGNDVLITHVRGAELTPKLVADALSGARTPSLRFTSVYLHLMGPRMVPVSPGQFVVQGARLGLMDSTGTSVYDHLHFSLHDNTVPFTGGPAFFPALGMSVRPTPMDGQSLLAHDDGRCIASSNRPVP